MVDRFIKLTLIFLLIFTPMAWGSMETWAFSVVELGILLMIILWSIGQLANATSISPLKNHSAISASPTGRRNLQVAIPGLLLLGFLGLVLLQMIPLPSQIVQVISPRTYELRHQLQTASNTLPTVPLSFFPFGTKIELLKWITFGAFFLFLLHWKLSTDGYRIAHQLIIVVMLMGCFEALYGIYGHFRGTDRLAFSLGTFTNRNYLAGYLLLVIPLTIGFLFSREAMHTVRYRNWSHRLSSLDGKSGIIGFGIVVMILGLLLTGSRMGILGLLLSFSLIVILLRSRQGEKRFSRKSALLLGLAVLWGAWVGLDVVISRFFTVSDDLGTRSIIWGNTLQIVKDFPVFGSGLGTFMRVFPMHRSLHVRGLVTHAENDFLQLISEVGLVGFGILFVLFVYLLWKAISGLRSLPRESPQRYIGIGGMVGILALMFHSLFERNIQVPANAFLYTFIWALVFRATHQGNSWKSLNQVGRMQRGN
jgi:O-antigen ligase